MNRSTRQLSLTLVILATTLAGCDVSFEESITPLVVNTLPPGGLHHPRRSSDAGPLGPRKPSR
jgi:hypothetical protein